MTKLVNQSAALQLPPENAAAMTAFRAAHDRKHAPVLSKLVSPLAWRILRRRLAARQATALALEARIFTGQTMHVMLPEVVSGSIYTYGYFDECVTAFMLHAVRSGGTVLDIGAHFGVFSLLSSHLVGAAGRVVSFEPTPSTYAQLNRNVGALANTLTLNVAIGREAGSATMNDFGLELCAWNFMGVDHRVAGAPNITPKRMDVPVVTVDAVVVEHGLAPTVVKIDTENYEEEVFLGARQTLADHGPTVILETKSEYSDRVGRALIDMGYQPYKLVGSAVVPATNRWEQLNHQESNLLFVKPG